MSADSTIRRREFIGGTTAAAAGFAFTSDALASCLNSPYRMTSAEYAQLIGQGFAVDGTSERGTRQRGTLVLKEVVPVEMVQGDNRPAHVRSAPFTLVFESQDVALVDGTHNITVGEFPASGIFLHEMLDQRQAGRRRYEAVFN